VDCGRQHGELSEAEKLADLVLEVQVLQVDPGIAHVA
jgi:hypothetical protein